VNIAKKLFVVVIVDQICYKYIITTIKSFYKDNKTLVTLILDSLVFIH